MQCIFRCDDDKSICTQIRCIGTNDSYWLNDPYLRYVGPVLEWETIGGGQPFLFGALGGAFIGVGPVSRAAW